jgi:tetratricopeptide (TPR) repeat protein
MGYLTYYLAWMALAYATRHPVLLVGAVLFFVFRSWLPDPVVWLRTMGRIRSLTAQIEANPANVTARRDLARMYLERLRPKKALALLDQARERHPDDAELLYLTGVARLRSGDAEGALSPLVRAVEIDSRILFGEPYLVAGDALTKLGRHEEAADAFDRYVSTNSSSVQGYLKLARARSNAGDAEGARRALKESLDTFSQVPGYKKRRELGWWMRAQMARLFLLSPRSPRANVRAKRETRGRVRRRCLLVRCSRSNRSRPLRSSRTSRGRRSKRRGRSSRRSIATRGCPRDCRECVS